MDGLTGILYNQVLMVGVLGWFVAQLLKVFFTLIFFKKLDFTRLIGSGGMPSSHSSFVTALSTAIGLSRGFQSAEFAICFVLACIVMYDAAGVRRHAGKQARVINKILTDLIEKGGALNQENLRELIGHTPFEVLVGALLGVLLAVIIM